MVSLSYKELNIYFYVVTSNGDDVNERPVLKLINCQQKSYKIRQSKGILTPK